MDLARELWGTNGPFVSSSAASLMDVSWPPAAPQSRGKPRAQHGAEIRALAFLGGRGGKTRAGEDGHVHFKWFIGQFNPIYETVALSSPNP